MVIGPVSHDFFEASLRVFFHMFFSVKIGFSHGSHVLGQAEDIQQIAIIAALWKFVIENDLVHTRKVIVCVMAFQVALHMMYTFVNVK